MHSNRKETAVFYKLLLGLGLLFTMISTTASALAQAVKIPPYPITLHLKNTNLDKILIAIQDQSAARFSYDRELARQISIEKTDHINTPLNEILGGLKSFANLSFMTEGNHIVVQISKLKTKEPYKDTTYVSGKVIDDETGEAVVNATLKIGDQNIISDETGTFHVTLPWGTYNAEVSSVGYHSKKITNIKTNQQQVLELNITLARGKDQLAGVTVTSSVRRESLASHFLRQKNAASLTDGISAEQISRTPDNNLGQVLKRVTGIAMADDKYAVVRGLTDRYNQGMIDGVVLPSTRMNRRDFSFDAIPAEVVSNVVVNKTATPDVSAEFSGGQISVNTLDVPTKNFTTIGVGFGYNSQSTGKDFYRLGRWGQYDFAGFDDKSRSLPAGKIYSWIFPGNNDAPPGFHTTGDAGLAFDGETQLPYNSFNAVEQSKKLSSAGLKKYRYTALPLHNGRIVLGRVYGLKQDVRIGFVAGLSIINSQAIIPFNNLRYAGNNENWLDSVQATPQQTSAYHGSGVIYRHNSMLGSVLNAGVEGRRFKIGFKNIFTSVLEDELYERFTKNFYDMSLPPAAGFTQQPTITQVRQHLLEGNYRPGNEWQIDYGAGITKIRQDMKDRRILNYNYTTTIDGVAYYQTPQISNSAGFESQSLSLPQRMWTFVDQTDYNGKLSIQKKLGTHTPLQSIVKLGYNGWYKKRDLDTYTFMIYRKNATPQSPVIYAPYELLLDPSNMGYADGKAYYFAQALNSARFTGDLKNHSIYLMADQKWKKKFRFIYGFRAEYFNLSQKDSNFLKRKYGGSVPQWATLPSLYNDQPVSEKNWRLLPSANIIYSATTQINIRGAYSRTAIRPDFRESSYFGMYDPELNGNITGRFLTSTIVDNIDLRFEWYPSSTEIFTIGGFYKYMDRPIELVNNKLVGQPQGPYYSYVNQDHAKNYGLEAEFRKSLNFIAPAKSWLQDVFVFGNAAYIHSTVRQSSVPGLKIVDGKEYTVSYTDSFSVARPLIGQVPWMVNGGLSYQGELWGITTSYNRTGYRTSVAFGSPDLSEYEQGRNLVDAQLYARFLKQKLELKLNCSNLLNEYRFFYQNINDYEYPQDPNNPAEAGKWRLKPGHKVAYNKSEGDRIVYREKIGRNFSLAVTYRF